MGTCLSKKETNATDNTQSDLEVERAQHHHQIERDCARLLDSFHCTPRLFNYDPVAPELWKYRAEISEFSGTPQDQPFTFFQGLPCYTRPAELRLGDVVDVDPISCASKCTADIHGHAKWRIQSRATKKRTLLPHPFVHVAMCVNLLPDKHTLVSLAVHLSVGYFVDEFYDTQVVNLDASERWCPNLLTDRYVSRIRLGTSSGFTRRWYGNVGHHASSPTPQSYRFGFNIPTLTQSSWDSSQVQLDQFRHNLQIITQLCATMDKYFMESRGCNGVSSSCSGSFMDSPLASQKTATEICDAFQQTAFLPAKPDERYVINNNAQSFQVSPLPPELQQQHCRHDQYNEH